MSFKELLALTSVLLILSFNFLTNKQQDIFSNNKKIFPVFFIFII